MKSSVKIELSKKRWDLMTLIFKNIAENAPIPGYEVESSLLAEYYNRNIRKFIYFTPNKSRQATLNFAASEGFALVVMLMDDEWSCDEIAQHLFINTIQRQLPATKQPV